MRFLTRLALFSGLLLALCVPVARADNSTPPAQVTAPPAIQQPTAPPVVEQPTAAPVQPVESTPAPAQGIPTPAPDTSPIDVAPEGQGQVSVSASPVPPTAAPTDAGAPIPAPTVPVPTTNTSHIAPLNPPSNHQGTGQSTTATGQSAAAASTGVTGLAAAANASSDTSSSVSINASVNLAAAAAAAPAQLTCGGRAFPDSGPFLVSPYGGWADINSFLDHDQPDYSVDGTIVLANGLTASSSDGQSSDFFPAYWSPQLRQFINYDGHNGYDFGISYQPVLAAAAGTVSFASWASSDQSSSYGEMILLNHHNGYVTLYGHLSELDVKKGDRVQAGQMIGISGTTGNSSGPHLHFSVFHNCQVTDPYGWTGSRTDPLYTYDGERAGYLWLPGHEPLVLNPPPGWPTFPAGLQVSIPSLPAVVQLASRRVPAADRLLLLDLPTPDVAHTVSTGVALARTEDLVTQEEIALTPYLNALRAQGAIQAYQSIPAAAAVWVHGTAAASQLEALPGVASLTGFQPRDLAAAQAGLAHSVLIQLHGQEAPSLWPVGFRSALHVWQPQATIAVGHSLITGFAPAGASVMVTLRRDGMLVGVAETSTDPETGGFVGMLHDYTGAQVSIRPGDLIELRSGGQVADIRVQRCSVVARSRRITGTAPAGESIPISLMDRSGHLLWHSVITSGTDGTFRLSMKDPTPAGTEAIGGFVDEAGNQESGTAIVPGAVLTVGSSTVSGWATGDNPSLTLFRGGRSMLQEALHPGTDGAFQLDLLHHQEPVVLSPGDVVRIGSTWRHRMLIVPDLRIDLESGWRRLTITGPPRETVQLTLASRRHGIRSVRALLNGAGHASVTWPWGSAGAGDGASAVLVGSTGDTLQAANQLRTIVLHMGQPTVTGAAATNAPLRIQVSNAAGTLLATAMGINDPVHGTFRATLRDSAGKAVRLRPTMRVLVQDPWFATTTRVPPLSLRGPTSAALVTIRSAPGQRITLQSKDSAGRISSYTHKVAEDGLVVMRLGAFRRHLSRVSVMEYQGEGIFAQRTLNLVPVSRHAAGRHALHRSGTIRQKTGR